MDSQFSMDTTLRGVQVIFLERDGQMLFSLICFRGKDSAIYSNLIYGSCSELKGIVLSTGPMVFRTEF